MAEDKHIRYLRIPLYGLFYFEDRYRISSENVEDIVAMIRGYDKDKTHHIVMSLEWAVQHADFPFNSLHPGLTHTSEQIYRFLVEVLEVLKVKESDL